MNDWTKRKVNKVRRTGLQGRFTVILPPDMKVSILRLVPEKPRLVYFAFTGTTAKRVMIEDEYPVHIDFYWMQPGSITEIKVLLIKEEFESESIAAVISFEAVNTEQDGVESEGENDYF